MIRKLALALGATIVLSAAALAPTSASAWGGHHHWHGGYGIGIGFAPAYDAAPDCYRVKRTVQFADGSWGKRWFTVCN